MKEFAKKNWLSLLTLILTSGVLLFTFFNKISAKEFLVQLKSTDKVWFIFAFLLIFAYWILDAFILHLLTSSYKKNFRFSHSFVNAMLGFLYSALTPFATGGQAVQVYEMSKHGVRPGVSTSIITVKSLIYQVSMVLFAVVCSLFVWESFNNYVPHFHLFIWMGLTFNLLFIGFLLMIFMSKKIPARIMIVIIFIMHKLRLVKNYEKNVRAALRQITIFRASMKNMKRRIKLTLFCFLVSIAQLFLFFSIPYCIYKAFNLSGVSLLYLVSANSLITMITAFVPLPGGSGAAESSFYWFFKMFFPTNLLFSVIIIWRTVTYFSCIIVGLIASLFGFKRKVV